MPHRILLTALLALIFALHLRAQPEPQTEPGPCNCAPDWESPVPGLLPIVSGWERNTDAECPCQRGSTYLGDPEECLYDIEEDCLAFWRPSISAEAPNVPHMPDWEKPTWGTNRGFCESSPDCTGEESRGCRFIATFTMKMNNCCQPDGLVYVDHGVWIPCANRGRCCDGDGVNVGRLGPINYIPQFGPNPWPAGDPEFDPFPGDPGYTAPAAITDDAGYTHMPTSMFDGPYAFPMTSDGYRYFMFTVVEELQCGSTGWIGLQAQCNNDSGFDFYYIIRITCDACGEYLGENEGNGEGEG